MPEKVKYKSKEYNEVYRNNQIANNYDEESDTYEYSLPEVSVNIRDNLNLGQVVRNGTSKVARPLINAGEVAIDFTGLSPALTAYNKGSLGREIINAAFEALPYINMKTLKLPVREADNIIKLLLKRNME